MKKNICIVYIITKLELGGAQKICLSLFEEFSARTDTYLISGAQGVLVDNIAHNPKYIALSTLKREVSVSAFYAELQAFFSLIKQLKNLKKAHKNIIVHTHSTKAGILGRWAALLAGIKTRIHTVHGYGFHPYQHTLAWLVHYILEALTCLITTHYICVSSADIKTGCKILPFFKHKYTLIRAAVPLEEFKMTTHASTRILRHAQDERFSPPIILSDPAKLLAKPGESKDERTAFIFGTVACFKPQKNLFDLLQAFELCHQQNPNTKLEIVGDGILRPTIASWIEQHNLGNTITLHGWRHNVADFMRTWDAFTLTSLWEGLPCAIIEARSLKLPVIAYDTGGISDVIFHEENGFLCAQKNVATFAQLMLKLSTNQNLLAQFQKFDDNLAQFDQQEMIKKHATLYRNL